jgi:hypothetical protein
MRFVLFYAFRFVCVFWGQGTLVQFRCGGLSANVVNGRTQRALFGWHNRLRTANEWPDRKGDGNLGTNDPLDPAETSDAAALQPRYWHGDS